MLFILDNFDYTIYTDGACLGNPGPGGWAAIIINNKLNKKEIRVGSEASSTNNRMELTAVIEALNVIPSGKSSIIYTDSKYVINGIESWIKKWKTNDWKSSNKKQVKNKRLWIQLDQATSNAEVRWEWVKGHSGDQYNEEVDKLARSEAMKL